MTMACVVRKSIVVKFSQTGPCNHVGLDQERRCIEGGLGWVVYLKVLRIGIYSVNFRQFMTEGIYLKLLTQTKNQKSPSAEIISSPPQPSIVKPFARYQP